MAPNVGRHLSRTFKKNLHAPAGDRTGDLSILSRALYHVAIKAGLYRKAVQVYHIPNLYPVIYIIFWGEAFLKSPRILYTALS